MCSRTPPGPKSIGVGGAQHHHNAAPPDGCVQISQHGWRWILPLGDAAGQNQRAIDQQQQPHEEPYRNNVMSFAHETYQKTFAELSQKKRVQNHYQKTTCKITNSTRATLAQKIGLCSSGTFSSFGIGV